MIKINDLVFGQDKRGTYYMGYIVEILNLDLYKIKTNDKIIEIHNVKTISNDEIDTHDEFLDYSDEILINELKKRGYKIIKN